MLSVHSPVNSRLFNAILLLMGLAVAWRGVLELRSVREPATASQFIVVLVDASAGVRASAQEEYLRSRYNLPAITAGDLSSRERLDEFCRHGGFVLHRYPATPEQAGQLAAALRHLRVPEPVFVELYSGDETNDLPLDNRLEAMRGDYPEAITWVVDGPQPIKDLPAVIRSFR